MNFGENLINLRKKTSLSQEQLADKLNVSRQAVSKWESGNSYPEMDKLMILCDLFGCTLDELVKGTIKTEETGSKQLYTNFYNKFSLAIASGVSLILLGLTIMLGLFAVVGEESVIPVVIFMIFVLIAVSIFILYGLQENDFKQQNKNIKNPYTKDDYLKELSQSFNKAIVIGVGLILIGVIFLIFTSNNLMDRNVNYEHIKFSGDYISLMIFMLFVTISVFLFVYYGIKRSKYSIEHNNVEINVDEEKIGKYSGVIMILATMIYLVLGFLFHLWHPGWIVFPLGGMLCGIVGTIFTKYSSK